MYDCIFFTSQGSVGSSSIFTSTESNNLILLSGVYIDDTSLSSNSLISSSSSYLFDSLNLPVYLLDEESWSSIREDSLRVWEDAGAKSFLISNEKVVPLPLKVLKVISALIN